MLPPVAKRTWHVDVQTAQLNSVLVSLFTEIHFLIPPKGFQVVLFCHFSRELKTFTPYPLDLKAPYVSFTFANRDTCNQKRMEPHLSTTVPLQVVTGHHLAVYCFQFTVENVTHLVLVFHESRCALY